MNLRLAILGLSHDHVWHELPAWESDAFEWVAVADRHPRLIEKFKKEFSATNFYPDPSEALEQASFDVALVMGSNRESAICAQRALEKGAHVVMEKPLAESVESGERLVDAWEKSDRKLLVNWPTWFRSNMVTAARMIEEKKIGNIFEAKIRMGHRGPREVGCEPEFCEWLYDPSENGGGAYIDYACYGAVSFLNLFGTPKKTTSWKANLQKKELKVDDTGVLSFEYEDKICTSEASWNQNPSTQEATFFGTRGILHLDKFRLWLFDEKNNAEEIELEPLASWRESAPNYLLHCLKEDRSVEGVFSPKTSLASLKLLLGD